jgi:uncharacterized membrane protein/thiol-disulfide isomerase/thioredoxin
MSSKAKKASPSTGAISPALLRAARACAAGALLISLYLAWGSIQSGLPVGCGPDSGCDRVLHSKWAYWFRIPVSVFAVITYVVLLAGSISLAPTMPAPRQRRAWTIVLPCALMVLVAAVWFVALQLFVIKAICPWCMTAHGLGFVAGLLLLIGAPPRQTSEKPWELEKLVFISPRALKRIALVALLGIVALIAGQVAYTPPTSKEFSQQDILAKVPTNVAPVTNPVTLTTPATPAPTPTNPPVVAVTPPKVEPMTQVVAPTLVVEPKFPSRPHPIYEGRFSIDVSETPRMGSPTNRQVMVSLFDYTCHHCRLMHPILKEVQQTFSNRLVIVSLPMPLDPKCNPTVQRTHPDHANACEYARLGLTVWRASHTLHHTFEEWLFAGAKPPPLDEARAYAIRLLGDEALKRAATDPWIELQLKLNIALYELAYRSGQGSMPQMIIGSKVAVGTYPKEELLKLLGEQLGLRP